MKKMITMFVTLATFLFLTAYAESITDNLPKEFFENADLYGKLEMIENLSVLDKLSENDLKVAANTSKVGQ